MKKLKTILEITLLVLKILFLIFSSQGGEDQRPSPLPSWAKLQLKNLKRKAKMENFSNYLEWLSGLVLFAYAFLAHYRINKLEKIIKELKK